MSLHILMTDERITDQRLNGYIALSEERGMSHQKYGYLKLLQKRRSGEYFAPFIIILLNLFG